MSAYMCVDIAHSNVCREVIYILNVGSSFKTEMIIGKKF